MPRTQKPDDYTVWWQALPEEDCAALVEEHHEDLRRIRQDVDDAWDRPPPHRDAPDPHFRLDGPLWVELADLMIPDLWGLALAERMGLEFGPASLDGMVGQYVRGSFLGPHVDDARLHFNFIVLLNDDFTGGEFVANGQVVPLGVGDLVGIGPGCVHEVRPVTSGERYVLGCGS